MFSSSISAFNKTLWGSVSGVLGTHLMKFTVSNTCFPNRINPCSRTELLLSGGLGSLLLWQGKKQHDTLVKIGDKEEAWLVKSVTLVMGVLAAAQ